MPNYETTLLSIVQSKASDKWEQLYNTLDALYKNEPRVPNGVAEQYDIDDDDREAPNRDVVIKNFAKSFYEILRKSEQKPGFFGENLAVRQELKILY